MVLPLELNGAPFSAEGLKSTKSVRTRQLQPDAESDTQEPRPEGYTSNSNKEALCLEYISNFRSQFDKLYPGRRRLFLTVPNEYGVEKFVCTTLRPTLLPYREAYDLEKCAHFVSNFLHYEPLERSTEPPSCLPSPKQVLEWTVGDSFDFAMVLCSFLIGAGYDAYVVYGTAPLWITARNRTRTALPYMASVNPQLGGEDAHENGVGMPPPYAAAAKADDKESSGKQPSSRRNNTQESSGLVNNDLSRPASTGADLAEAAAAEGASNDRAAESKAEPGNGLKGEDETAGGEAGLMGEGVGEGDGAEVEGIEGVGGELAGMQQDEKVDEEKAQPYSVKPRGAPISAFLADAARRAREAKEAEKIDPWQSDADEEEDNVATEEEEQDPLRGERVHAWVLVRGGKRGETGMSYVEPTTGAIYPTLSAPYLTVEGLFNDKNYWVNMQQRQQQQQKQQDKLQQHRESAKDGGGDATMNKCSPPGPGRKSGTGSLSFDLLDGGLWEFVFIDPMQEALEAAGEVDENDDLGLLSGAEEGAEAKDEEGDGAGKGTESQKDSILDLPPSWVRKLTIDRDIAALRYPPKGQRTILYRRSKVELYAENIHAEGTTRRTTLYKDRRCTVAKEVREAYVNRADRLYSRLRYPLEGKVSEWFRPGRTNSLRNLITWSGRRRELHFFVEARLDGLVSRIEEIGKKVTQTFQGRPDRLTYRSVNIMTPGEASAKSLQHIYVLPGTDGAGDSVVYKMTEKFERDASVHAHWDVAKRTYYLSESRIRTLFHYPTDDVTRGSKMHFKDNRAAGSAAFAYDMGDGGSGAKKIGGGDGGVVLGGGTGRGEMEETLQDAILAEKDCFTEARHMHVEMADLIKLRHRQEEEVALQRPVFETARERRAEQEKVSEQMAQEEEDVDQRQVDYLTPFLQHVPDMRSVSAGDAQRARDACLKALKDRLLERANIINSRLNEETSALAKKQAAFQRNQRENDANAEEEFEIFCSEAMFRIQVLEQRLVQHEENALKKYADVDAKLASDPRLRALNA